MTYLMLLTVNGLVIGLIYALMAAGLTLVFSVLKLVNFGHGSLYMIGGYVAFYAITPLGVPPIFAVLVAMLALFLFGVLLERLVLALGQALDAVSQNRDAAAVIGIDPRRIYTLAFGLGAALAGGAGALVGPIFALSPTMGELPGVQAFIIIIIVIGGMGSVGGTIAAGLLLGVVQGLGVGLLPDPNRALAYTQAFGAVLLMATLLLRPTGLFGRAHARLE